MKEVREYKLSSLSMALQKLIQILATILIVPLLLSHFSMSEYANYVLVMSIAQFFLLDVGVAENLKYSLLHKKNLNRNDVIVNGFVILILISFVLLIISLIFQSNLIAMFDLKEQSVALMSAILISVLIIPLRITREIYSVDNKVYKYYFLISIASIVSLPLLYIFLNFESSILLSILAIHGSLLLAHVIILAMSLLDKTIFLKIANISLHSVKKLLPGSFKFLSIGISLMIINGSDIILLSYLMDNKIDIGEFSLVQRLFIYAHMGSMLLVTPAWSFLVRVKNKDYKEYKKYLRLIITITVIFILASSIMLILYGYDILLLWTGVSIQVSAYIYILLGIYTVIRLLTDGMDYYLRINGIINIQFKATIFEAFLHVIFSMVLYYLFGLVGFLIGSIFALLFTRTIFFLLALRNA